MSISNIALLPGTTADHGILDNLIDRYKTLRLRALKDDPQAFSSKYENELQFPRERWQARIQNPSAHTFIALEDTKQPETVDHATDDSSLSALLSRKWMGSLTMTGPEPVPDSELNAEGLLSLFDPNRRDAGLEAGWSYLAFVLNAMYVLPEGRMTGNGRRLVERAVEYARRAGSAAGAIEILVLAFVEVENESALLFYQKCGFRAWNEEALLHDRYVRMIEMRINL